MNSEEKNREQKISSVEKDIYQDLPSKSDFLSKCGPHEKLISMNYIEWYNYRKIYYLHCDCPHRLGACSNLPDYARNNFDVYECPDFIGVVLTRETDQVYESNTFDASVHCRGKITHEWLCVMFEDYEKFSKEKGFYKFEDYTGKDTPTEGGE
jgi:hypothetical protein